MSGELVTVHQLEYLAVNVDVNSHVQIPHRDEFTFQDSRTLEMRKMFGDIKNKFPVVTCVRIDLLERDLMSSHDPALGHTRVLLGQFHHCQGVVLQVEIQLANSGNTT